MTEPGRAHAALQVVPARPQQEARAEQQVEMLRGKRIGVQVRSPLLHIEPAPEQHTPGVLKPVNGHVDAVGDEARLGERDRVAPLAHGQIKRAPRPPDGRSARPRREAATR